MNVLDLEIDLLMVMLCYDVMQSADDQLRVK